MDNRALQKRCYRTSISYFLIHSSLFQTLFIAHYFSVIKTLQSCQPGPLLACIQEDSGSGFYLIYSQLRTLNKFFQ